ncbi:MAG: TetR/AcrR family transcriptional regulator [Christensenella sp.]|uniref:TetR/AcrR family transcriptional regulator n=1 Tax=Christensenella sp. TaxID=1935934 RepID=UPI002B2092EC|nr:TetR/AcrR family transcriptional regulator [Christensenella sp.]MEA5003037.1 TetR/AcrR family transcriptional regulator [Christensenella sp.]
MNKRKEQKEQRRMQILEVALDLFIHKGYAATKISDIAEAADMSTGLLFHYFSSKEHLYEELMKIGVSGPESLTAQLSGLAPLAFFEQMCSQIFAGIVRDPFTAKMFVLMTQAFSSAATPDHIQKTIQRINYYELSVPMIAAGQKEGTIRDGDPLALSVAYWTAIQGVAQAVALYSMPCAHSEWIVDIIRRKP